MPLTQEQVQELKSQLSQQIQHLPPDKKAQAQKQIDDLSPEALETMLKQQQARQSNPNSPDQNKGVFRLIADKEIPSRIITEDSDSIAVLDIKPISKGHIIIIPKKAVSDAKNLSPKTFALARKLTKRISSKLKPKGFEIQTEFKFGEVILNIIPVYESAVNINSPRTDVKEEDLDEIHKILRIEKKPKIIRIKKTSKSPENQALRLKRRVP